MPDNTMGWLDRVIDFQFGGQWMVVEVEGAVINGFTCNVNFPDMAAGTPGFRLVDNDVLSPYPNAPRAGLVVTSALMRGRLTTLAGAGMTGFGERHEQEFSADKRYVRLWLQLTSIFPASTFRVRFNTVASNPFFTTLKIGTVARGRMRVGLRTSSIPLGSRQQAFREGGDLDTDFRVNPESLAVTGPF